MSNLQKWYSCKRDIGVTFVIALLVFLTNPIHRLYDEILHIRDDMGILGGLIVTTFVVIESLLIHVQHYWAWVVLSTFMVTAAAFISEGYPTGYSILENISMIVINGILFFLLSVLPAVAIVYFIKKKLTKDVLKRQAMIDIPFVAILLAFIWELTLIWIIFGI